MTEFAKLIEKSNHLFDRGDFKTGVALLDACPASERNAAWCWQYARHSSRLQKHELAHSLFARAWDLEKTERHGVSYVRSLAQLGCISEAETFNHQLIQKWPHLEMEVIRAAFTCLKYGEAEDARNLLETYWKRYQNGVFAFICIDFLKRLNDASTATAVPTEYLMHERIGPICESFNIVLEQYQRNPNIKLMSYGVEPLLHGISVASPTGWIAEFGVYFGRSINIISSKMDRQVFGFDSFSGLPEDWKQGEPAGSYSTHGEIPEVGSNVRLLKGWFKDTVPGFISEQQAPASLLHIDCDLYSSTLEVLEYANSHIVPGTVIVLDDFMGFPGYQEHEMKALSDYCGRYQRRFEYLGFALLSREAVIRVVE